MANYKSEQTVPVAFLGSMFILQGMGMSINMLSMLGLIIVLGMLVDDAIVVAENIYQKLEQGMDKNKAAMEGTLEVIAPVSGTIIIVLYFCPLAFSAAAWISAISLLSIGLVWEGVKFL